MNFRYPHLSTGYIGATHDHLTLNSKFYSRLEDDFTQRQHSIILFPQRIPRAGFFEELNQLETNAFKSRFSEKINHLINHLKCISQEASASKNESTLRHYLNWANLCLRYGRFAAIFEHLPYIDPTSPFTLELKLLKESAKIEFLLSSDLIVTVDNYIELADYYSKSENVSTRVTIMLLNQLIVTYYRYQQAHSQNKKVFDYAMKLLELLTDYEQNNVLNLLYCSVAYRGLAMVYEFGTDQQAAFLNKAEQLAINIQGQNLSDEIAILDNQYTCFQSIAKWHQRNEDYTQAELYLKKMIQIDPYDSTGYSELGFFYIENDNYCDAANCFKTAMDLGPPGAGMNAYYYAKCLEKFGKQDDAINFLHEATKLDRQAISPWLDLLDYYAKDHSNNDLLHSIASHINSTPILKEQLKRHELKHIQSIAG